MRNADAPHLPGVPVFSFCHLVPPACVPPFLTLLIAVDVTLLVDLLPAATPAPLQQLLTGSQPFLY